MHSSNLPLISSTLTDMKNRPVFALYPQGEQAGFSAFTPWGRGKKAEKPDWILICQSRISTFCYHEYKYKQELCSVIMKFTYLNQKSKKSR
jgi:hypothetical protein